MQGTPQDRMRLEGFRSTNSTDAATHITISALQRRISRECAGRVMHAGADWRAENRDTMSANE